jgi:hypothetical protein
MVHDNNELHYTCEEKPLFAQFSHQGKLCAQAWESVER